MSSDAAQQQLLLLLCRLCLLHLYLLHLLRRLGSSPGGRMAVPRGMEGGVIQRDT